MFYLCEASSENLATMLGRQSPIPEQNVAAKYPNLRVILIGQKPDCTGYLFLTESLVPELTNCDSVPEGYDFIFRQEWGLRITEEIIHRVIDTLRAESYPPMATYLDAIVKSDEAQKQKYLDDCLAVKAKYPKFSF